MLVAEPGVAVGGLTLDDRQRGVDPFLPPEPVLLGLGTEVIHVVEHHLVEVADPRVEVAGDGDVQDQRQAVPAGSLDPDVLLQGDDRLGGGGGADHQVGLDQGLAEPIERHRLAPPSRWRRTRPSGLRLVTRSGRG